MSHNPRARASQLLLRVLEEGKLLDELLAKESGDESALLRELCYGTLRWLPRLEAVRDALLSKPLRSKEALVGLLLCVGLYELEYLQTKPYAAVNETVSALKPLKKTWAKGLVNAVLRNFLREREAILTQIESQLEARTAHPIWWAKKLKQDWPEDFESILSANNARAPMVLRVNQQKLSRQDFINHCQQQSLALTAHPIATDCVVLEIPHPVMTLPGYDDGWFSVQDGAPSLAAHLLQLAPGQSLLDACAAPGGKTTHCLEVEPQLESVVALDSSESRLKRLQENLQRLQFGDKVDVLHANCVDFAETTDKTFDRILLDAPCSASGIVRRHVDIKFNREEHAIADLAQTQRCCLEAVWELLNEGGLCLYATCSVFKEENVNVITSFLADHEDAVEVLLPESFGRAEVHGRQILPGDDGMDGFYYALLIKQ